MRGGLIVFDSYSHADMSDMQLYILMAIVILALIVVFKVFVLKKRLPAKMSRLAGIAFVLIIAGMAFGDQRLLGYSLMGAGVLLALVDIVRQWRKK